MLLYLVQHGEAVSKTVDPDRPLSPKGKNDIERLRDYLDKRRVGVGRIAHSGKLRARQIAEIIADKLLAKGEIGAIEGINPEDPVAAFASKIQKLKQDTMLVGHLPFMAKLVSYLTAGNEDPGIVEFTPGSVVCLERDPETGWRITWMLRPDILP